MIRYVFRESPVFHNAGGADPQVIGDALAKVEDKDGELTAEATVKAARPKRSPLHRHFEWDDSNAAELYRRRQAHKLIRSIRILEDDEETKPAYLSIVDLTGRRAYRPIGKILAGIDFRQRALETANRDLEAWIRSYQDLAEACDLVKQASEVVGRLLEKVKVA